MTSPTDRSSPGVLGALFGIFAWFAFVFCVVFAILTALFVPGLERRRRWVTAIARTPFFLTAIRTRVRGLEKLPEGECVVVANHASYLDGVLLQAFLPPRFSYVIKGEMAHVPVVGFLPGSDSVYVACMHSGVTLAPIMGRYIAQELLSDSPIDELAPYRPGRFAS